MDEFTNEDFIKFLKSFKDEIYVDKLFKKHNLFDDVYEISRKDGGDRKSLIKSDFKMFSLDDMCHACKLLEKNVPKTTDALFYRRNDDGTLSLYFIEFKFHDLDKPELKDEFNQIMNNINMNFNGKYKCVSKYKETLNTISQYYRDDVEHKLILKPIESINIVVPVLYEEYCNKKNCPKKDIKTYLNNVDKRVFVFVSDYSPKGKDNPSKNRNLTSGDKINMFYERLKQGHIIDYYKIYHRNDWDTFIKEEQLVEIK